MTVSDERKTELEKAINHDQENRKWYAYGRAVLGGTDFIHPIEVADNGNVVCRTGSSPIPVDPDEYLRVHRENPPYRKVGIWDFTPYDDPAEGDIRHAHSSPNSAGRRLHDLRKENADLRQRVEAAEASATVRELYAALERATEELRRLHRDITTIFLDENGAVSDADNRRYLNEIEDRITDCEAAIQKARGEG